MRAAPSGSRGRWWLSLAFLLSLGSISNAAVGPPANPGLSLGRIDFHPSLRFDYGHDDNVFYSPHLECNGCSLVSSSLTVVRPQLLFDLPAGENWLRWSYAGEYRDYGTSAYSPSQPWSHFVDLDGRVRLGPRVFAALADHFVHGTQQLREVDPGGELTFGTAPFTLHSPSAEVGVNLGTRHAFSVVPSYSRTTFDRSGSSSFFTSSTHGLQARYTYTLTPTTAVYAYYGDERTHEERNSLFFTNVDADSTVGGIGLRKTVNRAIVTSATIEYRTMDFHGGAPTNFSGLLVTGDAGWLLSDVSRLTVSLRRGPYPSYFLNNNYYVSDQVTVGLTHQVGTLLWWDGTVGVESNAYSEPSDVTGLETFYCQENPPGVFADCPSRGVRRRDHAWKAEVSLGIRTGRAGRISLGYNHYERRSNMLAVSQPGFGDPNEYDVNRIFLRFEVGWL